jgi:predicted transcriptional regulator
MPKKIARAPGPHQALSRRERQIMDVIYRLGPASVAEVIEHLSGKPAYSTVRAQLRVLEQKGHLRHVEDGLRYMYLPTISRRDARHSMLRYLIDTFFDGSAGEVLTTLLGTGTARFSAEELDEIERLIERAKNADRP